MKFRIGYRTAKTAAGTATSIMLAQAFGLHNFVSAGIITILCIKVTKKKSLRASWDRLLACLVGMIFSYAFFEGVTYHPLTIGFLLLFFIPTVVLFKAGNGIVTSSVIILHIYSAGKITTELLINELGLILIGIGVALLINLYMPSLDNKLKIYQVEIEHNFKRIFQEISSYLRTNESDWDGKEITETTKLIEEAKTFAFRDVENHFLRNDNLYYHYFNMREKQFEIIERVLPITSSIQLKSEEATMIAAFIEDLSENIHPGNTADIYLGKLAVLRTHFGQMELPKVREEFESRASSLHFMKEMEQYLWIKKSFKGMNLEEKKHKNSKLEGN